MSVRPNSSCPPCPLESQAGFYRQLYLVFIDACIYCLQMPVSTACRCLYLLFIDTRIYCLQMPVSSVYRYPYLLFVDACIQCLQMPVSSVYRCLYLVFIDSRIYCLQMPVSTVCTKVSYRSVLTQFMPLPCKKAFDSSCRRCNGTARRKVMIYVCNMLSN